MSETDATARGVLPYEVQRVAGPVIIDGDVTKPMWRNAIWSPRFVDMVDGGPALYDTRAAALWDDENLYIAMRAEEPFLRASQTERDSIVFLDNDLEVFVDGGDAYYEFEINAASTVYEVLFVWKDAFRGSRFEDLDVHGPRSLTFAGDHDRTGPTFWRGRHPRGARWAFLDYDLAGLRSAVRLDGTLNDDSDVDVGWSVELALPWTSLCWMAGRPAPVAGDEWRIFFGRFHRLVSSGIEVQPHPAWCWTPHGVYDTHMPERFTPVRLSDYVAQ